jgi:hypothetical protein
MIHVVVITEKKKYWHEMRLYTPLMKSHICCQMFSSSETFPTRFVNNNEKHGVIVAIRAIHSLPNPQLGMCYFLT